MTDISSFLLGTNEPPSEEVKDQRRTEDGGSQWVDEEVQVLLYHNFSRLFLFQYEAQGVGVGSRHEAEKQRLLAIRQLTHKYCGSHTK